MAKRTKKKHKNPELRTGGGRKAKAERSEARRAQAEKTIDSGTRIRVRPAGTGGMAWLILLGWAVVALVALAGVVLGRWNVMSYPDSLWLYVAFGTTTAAMCVGRISRTTRDADSWGVQSLLLPLLLFVAELLFGPSCPSGSECAAVGARGSLGLVGSLLVIVVLAAAAWLLARWSLKMALRVRPTHGRVRYGYAVSAVLGMLLFPGSLIGIALIGSDVLLRSTPALAADARKQVERDCWQIATPPDLAVRAAPSGYLSQWTTFAVRRANESRPAAGKGKKLPSSWARYDKVHPYEATVSYNRDGELVGLTCNRIGPGSGNATTDDMKPVEPSNNPLGPTSIGNQFYPRFFTQGVAGPTEEGKKLIEQRKKDEAKAKREAAKDDKNAKGSKGAKDAKADKDAK